ncbi:alpha/beta hydrolase fold domain-containing protein [Arthrobacter sp. NPDC090010]|uniref:alpha/beta hydrolase fold domain-containing protein n=1 Tax=Arthrobacter sp. NPDC090010 TaxID=3363942 RepID=UPI003811A526
MPVDPEILRIYEAMKEGGPSPFRRRSIEQIRSDAVDAVARVWSEVGLPIPEVTLTRQTVPVDGWPDVDIRIHRPPGVDRALPAVISFFGGAFRQGSNDFAVNRWMYAQRAIDAEVVVVAVDYAQAPEHRFPTPIEQGLAVLDRIVEEGGQLGIDTRRLAVSGQSSGGTIAACIAQANLDRRRHPLRLQLLEVSLLDLTGKHAVLGAVKPLGVPRWFMRRDVRKTVRNYLGNTVKPTAPEVSPLLRENLEGLPPAVILAAEFDALRGDAAAYHARLREAGVMSSATIALGQTHDSAGFVGVLEAARIWHRTAVGALRTLHDPVSADAE